MSPRPQLRTQDSKIRTRGEAAFTLLELSLVLLLLAIAIAFVAPRLRDPSSQELQSHAHRLRTTFRFLRSEAVMNGRVYTLNYDLDQQRYWVTSENTDGAAAVGGDAQDELGILSKPVALPNTVAFSDIVFEGIGKLNQGQMFTRFFPDGYVEPTVVHMDNGKQAVTLIAMPYTGEVRQYEGYRDFEFQQ